MAFTTYSNILCVFIHHHPGPVFERSGHYLFSKERDLFDTTLMEWLADPHPTEP
jgi:hypothetical protein